MKIDKLFEKIRSDKKLIIIVFVGILGTVMLMFSGQNDVSESDVEILQKDAGIENLATIDDTEKKLESKLESIISSMSGVGDVDVIVTVASSDELIFAENIKTETDSDSSVVDRNILMSGNKDDDGAVEKGVKTPDVLGVAVVCQGADNLIVKSEITNLVTSLFGIGIDRVYVGNMT